MFDLDVVLHDLRVAERERGWSEDKVVAAAEDIARAIGVRVEYDPPDEEFVLLVEDDNTSAMVSVRLPLAFVRADTSSAEALELRLPDVKVVPMTDLHAIEFRADGPLIRDVLIRRAWSDEEDFDTEGFSAWDIFVLTV